MKTTRLHTEAELAKLAKQFREAAGVSKAEAGRMLGVRRGTVHQAEDYPETSLTKFRIKMIEKFGGMKVDGPLFRLRKA
jgi:DNA-binding XRE family transcriptional regulator